MMGDKRITSRLELLKVSVGDIINIFRGPELVTYYSVSESSTDIRTARRDGKYIEQSFYCNNPNDSEALKPFFTMKGVEKFYSEVPTGYIPNQQSFSLLIFNFDGLDAKLKEKGL